MISVPLFSKKSSFSPKGIMFHQKVHFYKSKEPTQVKVCYGSAMSWKIADMRHIEAYNSSYIY